MFLQSFCYYCACINFIQYKTNGGGQVNFLSRWYENSKVRLEERLSLFTENLKFITSHLGYKTCFSYFPLDSQAYNPGEEKCMDFRNYLSASLSAVFGWSTSLPILFSRFLLMSFFLVSD